MSNYEDIPEVSKEQTSKEESRWWEEEQVTLYHHHGQYHHLHSHEQVGLGDYSWYDGQIEDGQVVAW